MSDERKKAGVWPWMVAALVVPVLYVAVAPVVMYIMMECPDPYGAWAAKAWNIYRPLWFLMDHCPALSHLWYRYMDYWP
jgi:hypothetical protein